MNKKENKTIDTLLMPKRYLKICDNLYLTDLLGKGNNMKMAAFHIHEDVMFYVFTNMQI